MVLDLWGRRFQSLEGKSLPGPISRTILGFSAGVATPALEDLLKVSIEGVYMEPRASGARATDEGLLSDLATWGKP